MLVSFAMEKLTVFLSYLNPRQSWSLHEVFHTIFLSYSYYSSDARKEVLVFPKHQEVDREATTVVVYT